MSVHRYQRSDVHCTMFITAGHSSTLTTGPSAVISGDILTQGKDCDYTAVWSVIYITYVLFIIAGYLKQEVLFMPSSMHDNKLYESFIFFVSS